MTIANAMGAAIPAGSSQCGFTSERGAEQCSRTATVHAMVDASMLWSSPLCAEHLEWIAEIRIPSDIHSWGAFCNIPGAHWVISKPDRPGRCDIAIEAEATTHELANRTEGATR